MAADEPDRLKTGNPAPLLAEIERLKAELACAKRSIAELEARADVDPLLDILNRRGFARELRRALAFLQRYPGEAALLYVDLDSFKAVNDRHGHAAGDALLKAITRTLTSHVRASDVVARLGGDEFGVLLWNIGPQQTLSKARELEGLIGAVKIGEGEPDARAGASIGVASLTVGMTPEEIIDAADRAMYARKGERRRA